MTDSNSSKRMAEKLTIDPAKPISEQIKDERSSKPGLFRNILQKLYPSKPESLPSSQALESFKFDELDFHTEKGKKMLYTILRRYGLVFKSVKLKAAFAVPEVTFEFNNKKEKDVVEMFLNNLHPTSGLLQLGTILRDVYIDTTAWGTGFLDPIWDKKKTMIKGLKKIHPIEIDLIRDDGKFSEGGKVKLDKSGNPVGWIQRVSDTQTKEAAFERYAYLTFNTFGDEWLGISDLEPIYQTTWRLMNIEEGIATAVFRHGFPLYDVQVAGGTDGRPPTKTQLEEAAKEVAGLNYKSEFIHPPNYKIALLESFSMNSTKDYVDPFIDQIASLSDIPKFLLLGTAQEAKANTPELLKSIKPALKPSKDKLKLFFEGQILKPLMEANHISTVPRLIIQDVPLLKEEIEEEIGKEIKETKEPKEDKEAETLARKKRNEAFEKESEIIKENKKKPIAKRKHKFKAAEWTHPNGHPRCLICGDEERIGGMCEGIDENLKEKENLREIEKLKEKNKELERQMRVREETNKKLKEKEKVNEVGINKFQLLFTGTQASELISQERKQLVFSKKEKNKLKKNIGKEMDIVEDEKVIGKIKLREPRQIGLNDFTHLEYAHLISSEERMQRWPDETEFYVYEFDIIKETSE